MCIRDSLCPRHPRADDLTGAAHCCGHNVQITNMFAVAIGLQAVMEELAGDVVLFAVPAEEMIEIDYRNKLREQGKLKYMGGKQQLCLLYTSFPYVEEDMEDLEHKIIYYESSRGCPFSCQYCLSGNKNTVRFFPQERTFKELQWFIDHKVKQVK